jgi:hypothetical protein
VTYQAVGLASAGSRLRGKGAPGLKQLEKEKGVNRLGAAAVGPASRRTAAEASTGTARMGRNSVGRVQVRGAELRVSGFKQSIGQSALAWRR